MIEILSNLFTGIDLKTLVIAVALIIGVPSLAFVIFSRHVYDHFSEKTKRRLDYAMGVPGLCLLGIPVLEMLNGVPPGVFLIALFLIGFILMVVAAREVFLEAVLVF